jgi:lipopolysaccharide export system ATP-binding protein
MGYLAQDSSVFKQLSVEDNLMAILETRPLDRRARRRRQDELLAQFGLTHIRKTKANRVSGGERRRLEIARCLITAPKMIMLDEPFAGIDPKTVAEIQDSIRNLAGEQNIGILLTDHNVRETLEVTDRSYLIREGQVIVAGTPDEIVQNPDARRYYLGERFDAGHLLERYQHRHALPTDESAPGVVEIHEDDIDDELPGSLAPTDAPPPPPAYPPTVRLNLRVNQQQQGHRDDQDA